MKRQKEIFRVYNFEMKYRKAADLEGQITFSAVPLGAYFKPKRQFQTRETILREYAFEILDIYKRVLAPVVIRDQTTDEVHMIDVKA